MIGVSQEGISGTAPQILWHNTRGRAETLPKVSPFYPCAPFLVRISLLVKTLQAHTLTLRNPMQTYSRTILHWNDGEDATSTHANTTKPNTDIITNYITLEWRLRRYKHTRWHYVTLLLTDHHWFVGGLGRCRSLDCLPDLNCYFLLVMDEGTQYFVSFSV